MVCAGVTAVAAVTAALGPAVRAQANFSPDALVSGSTGVEANYAFDPAISADGRYVVYTASQAGGLGIYRRDLKTGQLDLVTPGSAGAPSISADGRYVSFTTTAADPATGSGEQCSSVYVRDMSLPATASGAYTLASALNGSATGLTYSGSGTAGCPGGGSAAAPRQALSADGRKVVFTVVGSSNLTTGAGAGTTTPPAQVAVRDLDTQTTRLITQTRDSLGKTPQPVSGGGAMTDTSTGVGTQAGSTNADPGDSTAAISADGTAVAWLGIDIPSQAPAAAQDGPQGHANEYDEPLWRELKGPDSPIRRVTGGDDPQSPCAKQTCPGPLDTQWGGPANPLPGQDPGPERGTLIDYNGFSAATPISASALSQATPQLSSNGRMVAFLSTQPATGHDPVYIGPTPLVVSTNVYLVNMRPGLTRTQALTRITSWGTTNFGDTPLAGTIDAVAISPEGDRLAFVTSRTTFPQSPPTLITPQLSQASYDQLYVVDLKFGTMELVSTGYDGQPANGRVSAPTFSAASGPIAFASAATNLAYGALSEVAGGQEVFTTTELSYPGRPGHQVIGSRPGAPKINPEWKVGVLVHRLTRGGIAVRVDVPGAGTLLASALTTGQTRNLTLAQAAAQARRAGAVTLRLVPSGRARRLIDRNGGIYALLTVRFRAWGHPVLVHRQPVEFQARPGRHHAHRRRR